MTLLTPPFFPVTCSLSLAFSPSHSSVLDFSPVAASMKCVRQGVVCVSAVIIPHVGRCHSVTLGEKQRPLCLPQGRRAAS